MEPLSVCCVTSTVGRLWPVGRKTEQARLANAGQEWRLEKEGTL